MKIKVNTDTNAPNMRRQLERLQELVADAQAGMEALTAALSKPKAVVPVEPGRKYPSWCTTKLSQMAYDRQLAHGKMLADRTR